jgi:alpha-mannosidase
LADISEADYGVAVLNDCKYGYDIHESVIGITLIKSGIYPNPEDDKEVHIFTYSLLPHLGDYRKGRVLQNAYDLNCPLYTREVNQLKTGSRKAWSLFSTDSENVILDTVKKAEASEDIILRIYEAYGRRSNTSITSPLLNSWEVTECNLMEEDIISSEIISPPEPAKIIEFLNSAESICSAELMSNTNLKNVIEPINTKIISTANYINTAE